MRKGKKLTRKQIRELRELVYGTIGNARDHKLAQAAYWLLTAAGVKEPRGTEVDPKWAARAVKLKYCLTRNPFVDTVSVEGKKQHDPHVLELLDLIYAEVELLQKQVSKLERGHK